jgi:hypothetical protein
MGYAPKDRFVAERWSWRSIAPWMVPPVLVSILLVGYVVFVAAS